MAKQQVFAKRHQHADRFVNREVDDLWRSLKLLRRDIEQAKVEVVTVEAPNGGTPPEPVCPEVFGVLGNTDYFYVALRPTAIPVVPFDPGPNPLDGVDWVEVPLGTLAGKYIMLDFTVWVEVGFNSGASSFGYLSCGTSNGITAWPNGDVTLDPGGHAFFLPVPLHTASGKQITAHPLDDSMTTGEQFRFVLDVASGGISIYVLWYWNWHLQAQPLVWVYGRYAELPDWPTIPPVYSGFGTVTQPIAAPTEELTVGA